MVVAEDDIDAIEAAGADSCLTKPIRQSHLYNCMAQVMSDRPFARKVKGKEEFVPGFKPARRQLRVLVAEDNSINQQVVLSHLRNMGHEAYVVDNGRAAINAWSAGEFDAILMDCHMPEMDGYAATREIRRREPDSRHIPIIALTANALEGDRERCLAAGMDDYLSKPIKLTNLAAVLAFVAEEGGEDVAEEVPLNIENAMSEPALSTERLEELRSELPDDAFRDLVEIFLREVPELVGILRHAVEIRDVSLVRETAHRFKGSCSTLGANRMATLCQVLQHAAEKRRIADLPGLVNRLEDEAGIILEILGRYVGMEEVSRFSRIPGN
jgi:CheY-like chemotaxis protein